ncbi:MAG: hypothetical protein ACI4DV_06855 [Lachnospiraceae bacterium]
MEREEGRTKRRGKLRWLAGMILTVLSVFFILWIPGAEEESSLLKDLRDTKGYIRTVGADEYHFFEKLVKRDSTGELSEQELERQTRDKINRVNAEFLLANQMGLCSPYSFESFQREMENENTLRKLKKEKKEVFYGPEEFDLITYYDYISGNLKLDMVSFVAGHADSEVKEGAENYFKDHAENYRSVKSIRYLLTEGGISEEKILLYEDMSSLEKTDSVLFDILRSGKEGDTYSYTFEDNIRDISILEITYEEATLKNNMERVMRDYITNVYLEDLILITMEKSPVEFKLS